MSAAQFSVLKHLDLGGDSKQIEYYNCGQKEIKKN
jgi:hypothetical protein